MTGWTRRLGAVVTIVGTAGICAVAGASTLGHDVAAAAQDTAVDTRSATTVPVVAASILSERVQISEISPPEQPASCVGGKARRQDPAYGWPVSRSIVSTRCAATSVTHELARPSTGSRRAFISGWTYQRPTRRPCSQRSGTSPDSDYAWRHGNKDHRAERNRVRVLARGRGGAVWRLRNRVQDADRTDHEALGARPLRRAPERHLRQPPATGRDGPLRRRHVPGDP